DAKVVRCKSSSADACNTRKAEHPRTLSMSLQMRGAKALRNVHSVAATKHVWSRYGQPSIWLQQDGRDVSGNVSRRLSGVRHPGLQEPRRKLLEGQAGFDRKD